MRGLDLIDKKILEYLLNDSRTSFLSISKELKISEGTVRQRVSKLQKKGVLRRFTIELGTATTAFVEITTSSSVPTLKISEKIKKLGAVRVFEVTGRFTIIAMIQTESFDKLNQVLEAVRSIEGVIQTETFPVLREY
jgi:DNA-binding Lrp family transcriptional regulator